jgi:hypothetical protein
LALWIHECFSGEEKGVEDECGKRRFSGDRTAYETLLVAKQERWIDLSKMHGVFLEGSEVVARTSVFNDTYTCQHAHIEMAKRNNSKHAMQNKPI